MRACRRAAPHSPRRGTRRVFTRPGRGAREKTSTATSRVVEPGKAFRGGAEKVPKAQAPHEHDGTQHAARFPAATRGAHALAQAGGPPPALHRPAEGHVLHERDRREPRKGVAANEDGLVSGGDSTEPRAQVHGESYRLERRMAALDVDVEAAP